MNAPTAFDFDDQMIDLHEVKAIVGLGKTMIYRMADQGRFPKPAKLGSSSRWSKREVYAWLSEIMARRAA